uniref:Uncharacterized protein n=1 Tax=Rhizophora mucronata TaxID=61149 RepID=A0A2P2NAX8_RHIMU
MCLLMFFLFPFGIKFLNASSLLSRSVFSRYGIRSYNLHIFCGNN